jgi:hypothetical protein
MRKGLDQNTSDEEVIAKAKALGFPRFLKEVTIPFAVPLDARGVVTIEATVTLSSGGYAVVSRHLHDVEN